MCGSEKWKLFVNEETGRWFCHAGSHGSGGRMHVEETEESVGKRLLALLHGDTGRSEHADWPRIDWPVLQDLSDPAFTYLLQRGVGSEMADNLLLMEHLTQMRVVVPFLNPKGDLIHWSARAFNDLQEGPKYLNAPGPHPLYVPGANRISEGTIVGGARRQGPVVVVEGPFDAIRVWQAGFKAVALGGKHVSRRNREPLVDLTSGRKTVILLDREALRESISLAGNLPGARVAIPSEADPGDMPIQAIRDVINEA